MRRSFAGWATNSPLSGALACRGMMISGSSLLIRSPGRTWGLVRPKIPRRRRRLAAWRLVVPAILWRNVPRRLPYRPHRARIGSAGDGRRRSGGDGDLGPARHDRLALARPGRDRGAGDAVHGALRDPRRAREADAGGGHHPEPRRVVDGLARRAGLRVRPAQGRPLPQRCARHRRRCEVLVRALQGRGRAALKKGEVDIAYLFTGPVAEELKRAAGLKLVPVLLEAPFWLDVPEQWDGKSPWANVKVRRAASLAIDRKGVNQAETLGFSRLTGTIIPSNFEFGLTVKPDPFDPAKAKQLLAEAGYPNGFDAGDFTPFPPYFTMGEAILGQLQSVGIRSRMRSLERAAFLSAWHDKKLKGIILGISGAKGNAATRIEAYVAKGGMYVAGSVPEIDDLFLRQEREMDRKKREALLLQIQKLMEE